MTAPLLLLLLFAQSLSQQGAQAMRDGRYADAERIYRAMLREAPGDPRVRLNLGLALHSAGRYAPAIEQFEAYLKAEPAPGPAHLLLGVAQLKLRQPCPAITALERAAQWQASPTVKVELGDAYFGCGRFAEAARTFTSLGDMPKALQGAGLSYARLGLPQQAQAAFDKLARLPVTPELHELLAEVHSLEGRHEEAVTAFDAALRLAPQDSRLQRLRARALWRAARYEEAQAAYAALAARWGHDPEFAYERGDTLVRTEGPAAGLPYLEQAVRDAPQLLSARGALGRALVQAGRAAAAVPHLEAAVAQDPTLLLPLSRAYKAAGRASDAARAARDYQEKVGQPQN